MINKVVRIIIVCTTFLPMQIFATQVNELCPDRTLPWTEPCYAITAYAEFPPPIRDLVMPPRIDIMMVNISRGERLFSASKIIHDYSYDIPTDQCPNGTTFLVGVISQDGTPSDGLPESGIAVVKAECK